MIIVSVDVETTGLADECEIVEVGAVVLDSKSKTVLAMHSDLLQVEKWSDEAERVHGISKAYCAIGHKNIDLYSMIEPYSPQLVVAHHAKFDKKFICEYWPQFANIKWLCTKDGLPHDKVNASSLRLSHLAADYNINLQYKHRALFDALTAGLIACEHDLESIMASKKFNVSVKYKGKPDFKSNKFKVVKQFLKDNGFRYDDYGWWTKDYVDESINNTLLKISNVSNWDVKSKEIDSTI